MPSEWEGYYLDGRTASRQRAVIRLMRSGLQVTTEGGVTLWWPYAEIRQTQGFYAGEQVRLERGGEISEALVVSDQAFLTDLHRTASEGRTRFHDPARRRLRLQLTFLAAAAVIAITGAFYLWGIPALAALLAPRVPVAWEERLGEAVIGQVAPPARRCDPLRARVLDDIVQRLTAPLGPLPYTFRVLVVNDAIINAFAAPGGYVVVFRGLLEHTGSSEELAGVLAHEMQHILRRHATRALLEHASTGLLLAALSGDPSGAIPYGLEGARLLGALHYSRGHEEEADREGMRMMIAAGIDPQGMVKFFESVLKDRDLPDFLKYLSAHPTTADRIEKLKALARASAPASARLLPDYDWRDIKKICPPPPR
ncbi:MAG: M48 family metallopeptidase [Candidatus Rokubacteria bacterium]|nr:M48 family metallopeptidase [Candidatus Rokubacteria bacterium]